MQIARNHINMSGQGDTILSDELIALLEDAIDEEKLKTNREIDGYNCSVATDGYSYPAATLECCVASKSQKKRVKSRAVEAFYDKLVNDPGFDGRSADDKHIRHSSI